MSNDLSYSSIITDISYQFCVCSYTFIRNFKIEQACTIFLDAYIRCLEIEHACTIFLDTYIRCLEIEHGCSIFLDTYTRFPELEHGCSIFFDTYTRSPEIEHACSNFFRHIYWIIRNKQRERKILRSRFRPFQRTKWYLFFSDCI